MTVWNSSRSVFNKSLITRPGGRGNKGSPLISHTKPLTFPPQNRKEKDLISPILLPLTKWKEGGFNLHTTRKGYLALRTENYYGPLQYKFI